MVKKNMRTHEKFAIEWVKHNYGRKWKSRLTMDADHLPVHYRLFHWYPFGRQDWNLYIHYARVYLARTTDYLYQTAPKGWLVQVSEV